MDKRSYSFSFIQNKQTEKHDINYPDFTTWIAIGTQA